MENASKALIIAGAILLSILIIALGIFVFNQAKNATNTDSLEDMNVSTFNQVYTNYNGGQYGSQVASLLDQVATNAAQNKDAEERLIGIVYVDEKKVLSGKLTTLSTSTTDGNATTAAKALFDDGVIPEGSGVVYAIPAVDGGSTDEAKKARSNYIQGISRLRTVLGSANKHKFQVSCSTDAETGLVNWIAISY